MLQPSPADRGRVDPAGGSRANDGAAASGAGQCGGIWPGERGGNPRVHRQALAKDGADADGLWIRGGGVIFMKRSYDSASCPTCDTLFERLPVEYDEDGGYVFLEVHPCSDSVCEKLLCSRSEERRVGKECQSR